MAEIFKKNPLDDDKFIIKKGTRLVDFFEKMDAIGAVIRREEYRRQQGLPTIEKYDIK